MHRGKRSWLSVVVLSIALGLGLAGCEPDKAESAGRSVKAAGGPATDDAAPEPTSTTSPPTTEAPTTTTQPPTTTTTAPPPPPPPPTTTTAKPKPTTTTAAPKPVAPAPSSKCHSSYTGTCIPPDVSDADCAGGSGNGPYYVKEKNIGVVGPDVYDLDGNDNDGIGCES